MSKVATTTKAMLIKGIRKICTFSLCFVCGFYFFSADTFAFVNSLVLKGLPEQGAIMYGTTLPNAVVLVGVDEAKTDKEGNFVFGVARDAPARLEIVSTDSYGTEITKIIKVKSREWGKQEINDLPDNMVNPSSQDIESIILDSNAMKEARALLLTNMELPTDFILPVEGRISASFGDDRVLNGVAKGYHAGIDIMADLGTDVLASADGIVAHTNESSFYNGKLIIINHGFGISSNYAHLDSIGVKVGQKVEKGEKIGKVGATGRAINNHLHFGIYWFNTSLDPLKVISLTKKGDE